MTKQPVKLSPTQAFDADRRAVRVGVLVDAKQGIVQNNETSEEEKVKRLQELAYAFRSTLTTKNAETRAAMHEAGVTGLVADALDRSAERNEARAETHEAKLAREAAIKAERIAERARIADIEARRKAAKEDDQAQPQA